MALLTQKLTFLVLAVLKRFFIKLEVIGKENIENLKSPVIVVSNHKDYFDHWLLGAALVTSWSSPLLPLRFFTADRFFKTWRSLWGLLLHLYGCIPTHKKEGLKVSLRQAIDILKDRGVVVFYPEGKVVRDENVIGKPRRGIGALALWSGAQILPVAIKGSNEIDRGVKIIIGKPFFIKNSNSKIKLTGREEDYVSVANFVMDEVKELYFDSCH